MDEVRRKRKAMLSEEEVWKGKLWKENAALSKKSTRSGPKACAVGTRCRRRGGERQEGRTRLWP